MTSEKSLRKNALFLYGRTLKKQWSFPLLFTLVLLFVMGSDVISNISNYKRFLSLGATEEATNLRNSLKYTFLFISDGEGLISVAIYSMMLVGAAALAISTFLFLLDKRSVNVHYSLPISRNALFGSKFLAGLTVIFISNFAPILIVTLINGAFYGFGKELIFAAFYIFLKFFSSMYYVFTVFSFVIVLLGSLFETLVIGSVVLVSPFLISNTISSFIPLLVFGSPITIESELASYVTYRDFVSGNVIPTSFKAFSFSNYLFPMNSDGEFLSIVRLATDEYAQSSRFYSLANFKWPLLFFAFVTALVVLTFVLHSKRKAEKAGFMGTCPAIEGYCVIVVGSQLASLAGYLIESSFNTSFNSRILLTLISGIVIMTIGYTVVDLFCVRSIKTYFKRIKNLGIELAIFAVIFGVFASGILLQSNRKIAVSEIESASVSVSDYSIGNGDYGGLYTIAVGYVENGKLRMDASFLEISDNVSVISGFTSPEDIQVIYDAEQEIRKCKGEKTNKDFGEEITADTMLPANIRVEYTLKTGKKVSRIYKSAPVAAIESLNSLKASKTYKATAIKTLSEGSPKFDACMKEESAIVVIPANLSSATLVPSFRDKELKANLFECIKKDIADGTLRLDYAHTPELMGYIAFSGSNTPEYTYDPYFEGNVATESSDVLQDEENSDYIDTSFVFTYSPIFIPVYSDMKNTVSYLGETGCIDLIKTDVQPVSVSYIKYTSGSTQIISGHSSNLMIGTICRYPDTPDQTIDPNGGFEYVWEGGILADDKIMPEECIKVSNPDEIGNVMKNFSAFAHYSDNVYYAQVKYEDGTYAYGFIQPGTVK